MKSLRDLVEITHEIVESSSDEALGKSLKFLVKVQELRDYEKHTLLGIYTHGPLWVGDVISKDACRVLIDHGFVCKVIVKGNAGYYACTNSGHIAVNLIEEGL